MRRFIIAAISVVVLAVLFFVLCTFIRRPYERILLVRFGAIVKEKDQTQLVYNLYFKWPTDRVVPIDQRMHLYTSPLKQVRMGSKESISVRTFAAWRIEDPEKFYNTTGGSDSRAMDIIGQKIVGLTGGKLSSRNLDEIFNVNLEKVKSGQIEADIAREATGGYSDLKNPAVKVPGLEEQGIRIVQVGFSRISFSPNNADDVYRRMSEERKVQALAYLAEGAAKASEIRGEGLKVASAIRAEAVEKSEKLRGEGDAKALSILAGVQQDPTARDFYQYWKSMDFYKSSFTKNTYIVLSTESDLLKNLFVVPKTGSATTPPTKP